MSRNADTDESEEPFRPELWISAAETLFRVQNATLSPTSHIAIATRAHAGLLRANAALFIFQDAARLTDENVPRRFWWSKGNGALIQNWQLGDFETWLDRSTHLEAFGVRFHRDDVDLMLGSSASPSLSAQSNKEASGRPMSALWPAWVAELTRLVHDEGVPENSNHDDLIIRVADRLAQRGLDAPARSTVQETVRAVLRRLRGAGN